MIESQPERQLPGVNIQDVEHDARPETRVDNAGVKVMPRARKPDEPDTDPEDEHQKGRETESKFQSDIPLLPPD